MWHNNCYNYEFFWLQFSHKQLCLHFTCKEKYVVQIFQQNIPWNGQHIHIHVSHFVSLRGFVLRQLSHMMETLGNRCMDRCLLCTSTSVILGLSVFKVASAGSWKESNMMSIA